MLTIIPCIKIPLVKFGAAPHMKTTARRLSLFLDSSVGWLPTTRNLKVQSQGPEHPRGLLSSSFEILKTQVAPQGGSHTLC